MRKQQFDRLGGSAKDGDHRRFRPADRCSRQQLGRLPTHAVAHEVYRLVTLDPKQLVASLIDMDALEPSTRLQVDADNSAIIAYASLADQFVIQSVIDRLDGSGRKFEVIQLRRLDAESVAGSIQFLMGAKEEKDNSNDRNRYFGYYDFNSRSNEKKKNDDQMRGRQCERQPGVAVGQPGRDGRSSQFASQTGRVARRGSPAKQCARHRRLATTRDAEYLKKLQSAGTAARPTR